MSAIVPASARGARVPLPARLLMSAMGVLLVCALAFGLSGCGATEGAGTGGQSSTGDPSAVSVEVICESEGVYKLFYTLYLNGESYSIGGWADYDHESLTGRTLSCSFSRDYFEDADVSTLAMDFSPYGEDDTSEIATTDPVELHAEYGGTYTIVFSGDEASGFTAELRESDLEPQESESDPRESA